MNLTSVLIRHLSSTLCVCCMHDLWLPLSLCSTFYTSVHHCWALSRKYWYMEWFRLNCCIFDYNKYIHSTHVNDKMGLAPSKFPDALLSTPGNIPMPGALGEETIICSLGDPRPPGKVVMLQTSHDSSGCSWPKSALLVIPGWADAVPALLCSWCSGAPRSLSKVCWCMKFSYGPASMPTQTNSLLH